MGFLRKKTNKKEDLPITSVMEDSNIIEDEDEFVATTKSSPISRKEFRRRAEAQLQQAVEIPDEDTPKRNVSDIDVPLADTDEDIEASEPIADEDEAENENTTESAVAEDDGVEADTAENSDDSAPESESSDATTDIENTDDNTETDGEDLTQQIPYEDDFMDDFSLLADDENRVIHDIDVPFAKKEKKPRPQIMQFLKRYTRVYKIIGIVLAVIFALAIAVYIFGCCTLTPSDVMGRNIYIENVDVSGLTYDEAYSKVKTKSLLTGRNITVTSHGQIYTINGVEAGLTARVEDTVDKAMRYGKTGNRLIDGLANTLQYFAPHVVLPSADVNEIVLRNKLEEFGEQIHGKLVQHQFEVGDSTIVCTPGRTGFSGSTDVARQEIINAINNEDFTNIRVTLKSVPPQKKTIDDLDLFTYCDPKNAHYAIENGDAVVVPEEWGRYLNKDEASQLLEQLHEGGEIVNIPYYKTEPEIKAAQLQEKLFNGVLASYYTTYVAGGNRGKNVGIAAEKINGKVLLPGEVFSFNETVGPRSRANGFMPAPEYANGQSVIGIGGGTCQVSTTLYNAVLYADLSIVYKLNHMFPVGYAPLGQDATVSDSGVDFKFSNNTDAPINITAVTGGGRVTVEVLGTLRDVKRTVKIQNYTSYVGADRSVHSYRMVYDPNGTLIRKDDLGSSYYLAH